MTPTGANVKLGLVIDLDTCVGCHACATACKEWNGASAISGPLADYDPYGAEPSGVWFNRIRHYEVGTHPDSKTINFPMSCLHCEEAACVSVCPTGASYKRSDGIVLVDQDKCMLGVGPQGLGGDATAFAVHVELAATHITMNPVAVNMQCHSARRASAHFSETGIAYGY